MADKDQSIQNVVDGRREERYSCMANIEINGFEGQALLRDINTKGFCMESKTYVSLVPKEKYTIRIKPEGGTAVASIEFTAEVRWVRSTAELFSTGFLIHRHGNAEAFQHYLDYLKNVRRKFPL
jgi:hypothetical protein